MRNIRAWEKESQHIFSDFLYPTHKNCENNFKLFSLNVSKRLTYLSEMDKIAKEISEDFTAGQKNTERVLGTIIDLYQSPKVEQSFKDEYFDTAYYSPITDVLEFLSQEFYFITQFLIIKSG